ncbi:hypothetical protein [Pontibacillus halophilus]|nr:hypothetical protein [Pontibacillus halophilus]
MNVRLTPDEEKLLHAYMHVMDDKSETIANRRIAKSKFNFVYHRAMKRERKKAKGSLFHLTPPFNREGLKASSHTKLM